MNPETIGALVAVASLELVLLVHAAVIARWSGKMDTLIHIHSREIETLREWKHDHGNIMALLSARMEEARTDINALGQQFRESQRRTRQSDAS